MKVNSTNFNSTLLEALKDRKSLLLEELTKINPLLESLENNTITNIDAAKQWVNILDIQSKNIMSKKEIIEKENVHRNAVNKVTYDVRKKEKINPDVNLLLGVNLSDYHIYFKESYTMWKNERSVYTTGEEREKKDLLEQLPVSEQQYLK